MRGHSDTQGRVSFHIASPGKPLWDDGNVDRYVRENISGNGRIEEVEAKRKLRKRSWAKIE